MEVGAGGAIYRIDTAQRVVRPARGGWCHKAAYLPHCQLIYTNGKATEHKLVASRTEPKLAVGNDLWHCGCNHGVAYAELFGSATLSS